MAINHHYALAQTKQPKNQKEESFPEMMEEKQTNAGDNTPEPSVISDHKKDEVDDFYEKLDKVNDSSGLSRVFNLREAMLDLHLLYREVVERGGFYQVTKTRKWDEVASATFLKNSGSISPAQLQNVYQTLLLQYELVYFYRTPGFATAWQDNKPLGCLSSGINPICLPGKRKLCNISDPCSLAYDGDVGPNRARMDASIITYSNLTDEKSTGYPDPPEKPRTEYQIFLKLEIHRLKKIHGKRTTQENLREMADKVWRSLPAEDKLRYIEASRLDRERYDKEMTTYTQWQNSKKNKSQSVISNPTPSQSMCSNPTPSPSRSVFGFPSPSLLNFSTCSQTASTDDVYHVTMGTNAEDFVFPDESLVEVAVEVMKNAPSDDPIFQFDWDENSYDMPGI